MKASGNSKSTIARILVERLKGVYLRIDTIEQALRACWTLLSGVVTEGYAVAYRVAEDNLRAGSRVVADSVNPLMMTREAWARSPGVRAYRSSKSKPYAPINTNIAAGLQAG